MNPTAARDLALGTALLALAAGRAAQEPAQESAQQQVEQEASPIPGNRAESLRTLEGSLASCCHGVR